jgi:hypothetical protein
MCVHVCVSEWWRFLRRGPLLLHGLRAVLVAASRAQRIVSQVASCSLVASGGQLT